MLLWLIPFLTLHIHALAQALSFVRLHEEPEFTIVPDEVQVITLSFIIKEGYHIQANQVKDENLIPSALTIETSDAWVMGNPIYPQSTEFRMKGAQEPLQVYGDVLEIKIPVNAAKSVKKGAYHIKGTLHYQACDATKCFFPRDLNFVMVINVP